MTRKVVGVGWEGEIVTDYMEGVYEGGWGFSCGPCQDSIHNGACL